MRPSRMATIAAVAAITGCAGNGEGLDENGRPVEEGPVPLEPQLSSIQENVFTPFCTTCHSGSAAPLGLRLDAGASYAMLVNAPSVEVPSLLRVSPGNPDTSYLIQKIEGTAAVGARMPLNGPPLPAETIAVIRQWIAAGAPASADAGPIMLPTRLKPAWPVPDSTSVDARLPFVIESTRELDTSLLSAGTVQLMRDAGSDDGVSATSLPVRIELRSLEPTVFSITSESGPWPAGRYELRISGSAPLALAGRDSMAMDGDGDGSPGGDFVMHFDVGTAP